MFPYRVLFLLKGAGVGAKIMPTINTCRFQGYVKYILHIREPAKYYLVNFSLGLTRKNINFFTPSLIARDFHHHRHHQKYVFQAIFNVKKILIGWESFSILVLKIGGTVKNAL